MLDVFGLHNGRLWPGPWPGTGAQAGARTGQGPGPAAGPFQLEPGSLGPEPREPGPPWARYVSRPGVDSHALVVNGLSAGHDHTPFQGFSMIFIVFHRFSMIFNEFQ